MTTVYFDLPLNTNCAVAEVWKCLVRVGNMLFSVLREQIHFASISKG